MDGISITEQNMIFEMLDSSIGYVSLYDRAILPKKKFSLQMKQKRNVPLEVIGCKELNNERVMQANKHIERIEVYC